MQTVGALWGSALGPARSGALPRRDTPPVRHYEQCYLATQSLLNVPCSLDAQVGKRPSLCNRNRSPAYPPGPTPPPG